MEELMTYITAYPYMCNSSFQRGVDSINYCLPIFGMCKGLLSIIGMYNGPFMEKLITALPYLVCVIVLSQS